ncbi:MAG: hypothetical protein Kow0098_10530 [Ignavibacteriaceae bacterium]
MRILPQIIILIIVLALRVAAQSPHGDKFQLDCSVCHEPTSWKINTDKMQFNHDETSFGLEGQHLQTECRSCHATLKFDEVESDCFSCHKDLHSGTVGFDCGQCHSADSWIVKDIKFVHDQSRFPLLGVHQTVDCIECHSGYTDLNFEPIGAGCFECHSDDYFATSSPNHVEAGFSTDCENCHEVFALTWSAVNVVHDFFPLVGGHAISDCFACHEPGGNFAGLSGDCYACHQADFENTRNPDHVQEGFSTDCVQCHNIFSFVPSTFDHNATSFPLTGQHVAVNCSQCHTSGYSNTPVECYACHQQDYENVQDPDHISANFPTRCEDCHNTTGWSPADFDHNATAFPLTGSHIPLDCSACHSSGFTGTPADCYACHQQEYENVQDPNHVAEGFPLDCALCHNTVSWDDAEFDHNSTAFPLTGAHISLDCAQCHSAGYSGTPTDCYSCHQQDYENVQDPNHVSEGFSFDCTMCHNTDNWEDADFDHNQTTFPLTGAHTTVDCSQCHANGYSNTPTDCFFCHETDYNNAVDPDHIAAGFPPTCEDCHTTIAWEPASFDHDGQYFPIYSGKHAGEWGLCVDCHNVPNDYSQFTCIDCHEHNQQDMDDEHQGVEGYVYISSECYACHPNGEGDGSFNHLFSDFPLTGAHTTLDCQECHQNGYSGTSTICEDCHLNDYNAAANPNHTVLGINTNCESCHTTDPDWQPALYPQHDLVYPFTGQHLTIAEDCFACHQGNYNNVSSDCSSCHQDDFNNTTSPNHSAVGISDDCESCHTTNGWVPSTFDHSTSGFELTGQHAVINCTDCHNGVTSGLSQECVSCHEDDYNIAPDHLAQAYPTNCEMCHTTKLWSEVTFDHNITNFPLTGAHITVLCGDCHENGFTGTTTLCYDCHQDNYQQSTNPDHETLILPTDCESCHTTNPGWEPATFPIHDQFYQLTGEHANISNDCDACHNGDYNNTPDQCVGCHQDDYNSAVNPDHGAAGIPTTCEDCHIPAGWVPSTFNHETTTGFALTGQHAQIQCSACHVGSLPGLDPSCASCHLDDYNAAQNPNHLAAGIQTTCEDCHNTVAWIPSTFDHSITGFELTGQHASLQCSSCHEGTLTGLTSDCFACHEDDYKIAPDHLTQAYPINCEMCHNTNAWSEVTFDHNNTNFPLTGAHLTAQCSDCHEGGFAGTSTLCFDCHESDYTQTTNPDHKALSLPTDCETCHTTDPGWAPASFPIHNQFWVLIGAHANISENCDACHNGNYVNTPNTCFGCHENDYNGTTDPPHAQLGFSTDCTECHDQNDWKNGNFNHSFFPLSNDHTQIECSECHSEPNYQPQCLSCHLDDFLDEHDQGDPTNCWDCHSTFNWDDDKAPGVIKNKVRN